MGSPPLRDDRTVTFAHTMKANSELSALPLHWEVAHTLCLFGHVWKEVFAWIFAALRNSVASVH